MIAKYHSVPTTEYTDSLPVEIQWEVVKTEFRIRLLIIAAVYC